MASNTPNLNLLKKDPMIDGDDTFNIKTMLNDNWDKIDAAMGQVDIPDASLTVKGKVQLSSATDSAAENQAATPKAIKDAALQAKSYTDQQISLVTETGIPKLVSYPLLVTATADNQKVFEIPLDLFDANTDTLLVAINRAVLDATQYTLTNTVRDGAGQVTQRAKINLLSGVAATSEVTMVVLKNVPIGPDGAINGGVLATGSVPINRVDGLQDKLDQAFQAGNKRKSEVVAALVALGISAATSDSWDSLVAKLNGIINRGAGGTVTPGTTNQTKAAGYYSSAITILGDADLVPGNIKTGVNIFGVIGSLIEGKPFASGKITTGSGYSPSFTITGLTFRPRVVAFWRTQDAADGEKMAIVGDTEFTGAAFTVGKVTSYVASKTFSNSGMTAQFNIGNTTMSSLEFSFIAVGW